VAMCEDEGGMENSGGGKSGGVEGEFSSIADDRRAGFEVLITALAGLSDAATLTFDPALSASEREFVHSVAGTLGMESQRHGEGNERYIAISKVATGEGKGYKASEGKGLEDDFSGIPEPRQKEIKEVLKAMAALSNVSRLEFAPAVSLYEAEFMRSSGTTMGLASESHGNGRNRYFAVSKPSCAGRAHDGISEVQAYEEALFTRMEWFPEGCVEDGDSGSECESNGYEGYHIPTPEPKHRAISLSKDLSAPCPSIVGTELSGVELFRIPGKDLGTVLSLQKQIADVLLCLPSDVALFKEGEAMDQDEVADDVDSVVARQALDVDPNPILVCTKSKKKYLEPSLGEGSVRLDLSCLPDTPTIQAVREHRAYVTDAAGEACWLVYTKKQVLAYSCGRDEALVPVGFFPPPPSWPLPSGGQQWGGARCDVWSVPVELPSVRPLLDAHAAQTADRPIPRYQMIVDPNLFVREEKEGPVWVPCEFDVDTDGDARLAGGDRSHVFPELTERVATPVLKAALPLLAKLRRPRLLLAGRRLQVVFKAQRIIVPATAGANADSEYVGLWHVDGHRENVAAVVLYYYKVDPSLQGGDMEFCGREPMDVLGIGDCSNNYLNLNAESLRTALRSQKDGTGAAVQNCRVPVTQGTLLVFSNYQMAHRVLRMVNKNTEAEASRDFVALFIIDPATKPMVPAQVHLASCKLPSEEDAKNRRNAMLLEQLQPQGEFVGNSCVHATGNGCYTMIGWLHHMLGDNDENGRFMSSSSSRAWRRFRGLNCPPKKQGRGMSEVLSLRSSELDRRLESAAEGNDSE